MLIARHADQDFEIERYLVRIEDLAARLRAQLPDDGTSPPVILVSETAARTLFRGVDPIGRRVKVGGSTTTPWRTIVAAMSAQLADADAAVVRALAVEFAP